MARQFTDHSGKALALGPLLGRGGEGSVFDMPESGNLVAKVYHHPLSSDRKSKIEAMIRVAPPGIDAVCAWPKGLVFEGRRAMGLVMPRVPARKELHLLHGPKSRKQHFPSKGYDFLVHVAGNVARGFALLHAAGIVIGDVNDRGFMVGDDGTVRLIDCDSFQVRENGRTFTCDVGVMNFTPPELQGKTLTGAVRTADHDVFGLAVIIFQLLFMGRHPFAGVADKGAMIELETAIQQYKYAYSIDRRTGMQPPPRMMTITTGAGATIASLFEKTFGPGNPAQRPRAEEWVQAIDALKKEITGCRFNKAHAFVRSAGTCPWCELEQRFGVDFFQFIPATANAAPAVDIEAILRALGALKAPSVPKPPSPRDKSVTATPLPPELLEDRNTAASARTEAVRALTAATRLMAAVNSAEDALAAIERDCEAAHPALQKLTTRYAWWMQWHTRVANHDLVVEPVARTLHFICVKPIEDRLNEKLTEILSKDPAWQPVYAASLVQLEAARKEQASAVAVTQGLERAADNAHAVYQAKRASFVQQEEEKVAMARQAYDSALTALKSLEAEASRINNEINSRLLRFSDTAGELARIERQRTADLRKLRDADRDQQLEAFLDTMYIDAKEIKGVPAGLIATLKSFGVETAADINVGKIGSLPGFGEVRTKRMLEWRRSRERRFKYVANAALDPAKVATIEQKYAPQRLKIERDVTTAKNDIERSIAQFNARLPATLHATDAAAVALAKAQLDRQVFDL